MLDCMHCSYEQNHRNNMAKVMRRISNAVRCEFRAIHSKK